MLLNVVNELNTPKKILSLTLSPDLTFGGLKEKLIKDKLIGFEDTNSIQVWQTSTKLFADEVLLKDSTLKEGDTILLKLGPKIILHEKDKYIKTALDMGFSKHMLLAAVANADGKTDEAIAILMDTAAGLDGYQSDDEDEFGEYASQIQLALDHLRKNYTTAYEKTVKDPELHRIISVRVADAVDDFRDAKKKNESLTVDAVVLQATDRFAEEAFKIFQRSQLNTLSENSNVKMFQEDLPKEQQPYSEEDAIKEILSYGFSKEQAVEALRITNKDVEAAVELLFSIQEEMKTN